jgi:hypothetical protein
MLTLDPSKRISAKDALNSDFFWETLNPACDSASLPMRRLGTMHEWEAKQNTAQTPAPPPAPVAQPYNPRFAPHQSQLHTTKRGFEADTVIANKRPRDNNYHHASHPAHLRGFGGYHSNTLGASMGNNNGHYDAHNHSRNVVGVVTNSTATMKGAGVPGGNLIPGVVVVPGTNGKRLI